MVTAELLLCVLCSVHGTRTIQVLHKDHDELAAAHTEIFTPQVGKKTFWCTITPLWQVFKLGPVVIVHLFSRFQYHVGVY